MAVTIKGAMYSNSSVMWKHYNWVKPDPAKRYKFKAVVTDNKGKTSNISWFEGTNGGESFHNAGQGALARADVSYIETYTTGAEVPGTQVPIGYSNYVQLPGTPPAPNLKNAIVTFENYNPNGRLKVDWAGVDAVGADDPNTDGVHAPPWPASRYYWYWKSSSSGPIRGSGYTAYATSGIPSPSEITFDAVGYQYIYVYLQSMGDYYNSAVTPYRFIEIPPPPKPSAPMNLAVQVTALNYETGPYTVTATWSPSWFDTGTPNEADGFDWYVTGPEYPSGQAVGINNNSVTFTVNTRAPDYGFNVRSYNRFGSSYYEWKAFAVPPPEPPKNVTFTLNYPSLTVSWDPIANTNYYGLDLYGPTTSFHLAVYSPDTSTTFTLTETGWYSFEIRAFDFNGTQGGVGYHNYEVIAGKPRPANWEWYTPKVNGQDFKITAAEWNAFIDRINEFLTYKNINPVYIPPSSVGTDFTANDYMGVMSAVEQASGLGWTVKFSGDDILAADINALRDNLNSTP